jgi:hypothetical protein
MRRIVIAVGSVTWMLATATLGAAFTHVTEYSTNLDNYRVCAGDEPLGTCAYEDVRSPSVYHLTNGTKGTLVYTGTVAKVRIDAIELDTNHPAYPCVTQSYHCVPSSGGTCPKKCEGPRGEGTNPPCCATDAECQALACDGGPQDDRGCLAPAPAPAECRKVDDSRHWSAVFRGNDAEYECPVGVPCPFLLRGDDDSGCMVVCDFTLESAGSATSGSVNNSSVSCQTTGACWYTPAFNHVEIRDPEGNVVAIPKWGNAKIIEGFPSQSDDPAKIGDACRTEVPPPADCP